MRTMNDTQNQIIIKTASQFGYWCANGKVAQSINNKLLK